MGLFNFGRFKLHSGKNSNFKIDCDFLTDADLNALANLIRGDYRLCEFIGVPKGGLKFAKALNLTNNNYNLYHSKVVVDDVLTTGHSILSKMWEVHAERGLVIFARGPLPEGVDAIFKMYTGPNSVGRTCL